MIIAGKCSEFGGKDDAGMSKDTGLSFYEPEEADAYPDLFEPKSDYGDEPTWKRLRIDKFYIALNIPIGADRKWAQRSKWLVKNVSTDKTVIARLVDRGPSAEHRVADLSPGIMACLGLKTDDTVIVEEILDVQ